MAQDDNDRNGPAKAPPEVVWLKRLVTGLAVVMGAGIIAIVAILWVRLGTAPEPMLPILPEGTEIPADVLPAAVTFARDWMVIVSDKGEILLFDRAGALRNRVALP